jgi:uncharacterized membrane protein
MPTLLAVATVGVGVVTGVFFAFSAFVMAGLDRATDHQATAAMRGINETAVTPVFMLAFMGTAVLCVALAIVAGTQFDHTRAKLAIAGAALYLIGPLGTTIAANVPLNDRLAHADITWSDYVGPWLAFNHVRTLTGFAALAGLVLALIQD